MKLSQIEDNLSCLDWGQASCSPQRKIFDYILNLEPTVHFLLYKIAAVYLQNLFLGNKEEAQKIKDEMKKYGYQDIVKTWPK